MRDSMSFSRRRAVVAALLTPLVLASCGHRLEDAELGLGDGSTVTQTEVGAATGAVGDAAGVAADTSAGAPAAVAPGAAAPQGNGGAASPAAGGAGGAAVGPGTKANASAAAGQAPAAAVSGASAACTKTLEPILLGQNGTFSGFLQASLGGFRPGLAAWAADVNARGGVQCHPIKLFQVDDGSNPAKTVSNTKDLIDNKKVVAMVGAVVPFNITSYLSVTEPAGIPTIGGDNVDILWDQSKSMYPTGVTVLPGMAVAMKASAERTGKRKFAVVYCVEAAPCALVNNQAAELAKQAGVQIVNKQSISLTQTDYTSNCQTAKNAGADTVLAVFDSSALLRFFRSCAAIGYYPPSATIGLAVGAASAADPNVQKASVTVTPVNAPHINAFTPGVAEFLAVMKKYAPGVEIDSSAVSAFAAGKMFEAALAAVADEARRGPVTTELILKGLHSVKNEKLGGLVAAPITYKAGENHATRPCAFVAVIQSGGLSDPTKGKAQCIGSAAGSGTTESGAQSGSHSGSRSGSAVASAVGDMRWAPVVTHRQQQRKGK